jgi:hypothetical protein
VRPARGRIRSAATLLADVGARSDSPETGVAHLAAGLICWFASEARDHFEWALALFQPGRDDDLAFRFGIDPGVAAMAYLVAALWPLGASAAISLNDRMLARTKAVDWMREPPRHDLWGIGRVDGVIAVASELAGSIEQPF